MLNVFVTQAWSHSPEIISYLKTLSILVRLFDTRFLCINIADVMQIYGGGPLSFSVGDRLVKSGVPLCNGYGGTEFGNPTVPWDQIPRDDDWFWFRFRPNSNMRFESQGDGTYELVVVVSDISQERVNNGADIGFSLIRKLTTIMWQYIMSLVRKRTRRLTFSSLIRREPICGKCMFNPFVYPWQQFLTPFLVSDGGTT